MLNIGRNTVEIIEKQLRRIIGEQRKTDSVGLLYSGGLDSSILAKIMTLLFPPSSIVMVCVGLPNSYDLNNATIGATELGIKLYTRFLTMELILETIQSLKQMNIIHNPVALTIAIPIFLGMQTLANKFHTRVIFLGQGADELFGGYQRYIQLYKECGLETTKKTMIDDLRTLQDDQIIREQRMAQHFGINSIYPFLDLEIINRAQSYPITTHIVHTPQGEVIRKALLRKLAKKLGLSEKITKQPKKAIQYGSGTVKLLRKLAKSKEYQNIPDWFQACFPSENITPNQIDEVPRTK